MSERLRVAAERDAAFRIPRDTAPTPPSRLYLSLTERCNLRCEHCITRAPERTASGEGRHLGEAVLDALTPHLADLEYVAFTHAGEPTFAPLLEETLTRLQAARAGRPTVVHMLTNGLALGPRRFEALAGLGLRSLSFSIDGMRAASHDRLRVGSSVQDLLTRITELARRRAEGGLDVRMGLALTLTRANLEDLPALVDFAAATGLDWVKLEELVPVNAVAEALLPEPSALAAALTGARTRAEAAGVPLVDHATHAGHERCDPDPEAQVFLRGDDLVNRVALNRCRAPFEVICVDANGDVHPVDFTYPVAGNLLDEPLEALWNGPIFRRIRGDRLMERPCRTGPTTCPPDPGPEGW